MGGPTTARQWPLRISERALRAAELRNPPIDAARAPSVLVRIGVHVVRGREAAQWVAQELSLRLGKGPANTVPELRLQDGPMHTAGVLARLAALADCIPAPDTSAKHPHPRPRVASGAEVPGMHASWFASLGACGAAVGAMSGPTRARAAALMKQSCHDTRSPGITLTQNP